MRQNRLRGEDVDDSENEIYSDNEGGEDDMDRFEIDEKQKEFKQFLQMKA